MAKYKNQEKTVLPWGNTKTISFEVVFFHIVKKNNIYFDTKIVELVVITHNH